MSSAEPSIISDDNLFLLDDSTEPLDETGAFNSTNASSSLLQNSSFEGIGVPHPNVLLPYSVLLSIAIYLTVVGILSTFGNILFIFTVTRWRYLRNNSHMVLLINMAVADLAISVTGYPYTTISGYIGRWIFGSTMCQLYAFLCFTFSQVSMNTLVAVSIFRYIAICHPHMKHFLTSRTSLWALVAVWCHALFWTTSPLLGWSSYTFEPTRISCSFDWNDRTFSGISYVMGTILFCYLSHIAILVWCYKRIFQMVTRFRRKSKFPSIRFQKRDREDTAATTLHSTGTEGEQIVEQPEQQEEQHPRRKLGQGHCLSRQSESETPPDTPKLPICQSLIVFSFATENLTEMELHVLGMNVAMVSAFIIFWTPYAIISVVSAFYERLSPFWYIFPTIFAKTSCMMNPILYGLTNSFLRKQLMLALRGFLGLTSPIEDFEVMRQRQQDGLYNKEGIFVGRRAGTAVQCACEGCSSSRRQIPHLMKHQSAMAKVSQRQLETPSPRNDILEKTLSPNNSKGDVGRKGGEWHGGSRSSLSRCGSDYENSQKLRASSNELRIGRLEPAEREIFLLNSVTTEGDCGENTSENTREGRKPWSSTSLVLDVTKLSVHGADKSGSGNRSGSKSNG